ncbi:MAG: F0F1 ATP synthase subunit delta [Gammaproteobacteria bacterium]|jgi:F-type H+-transporting ATPase subunit delta|nr:F0F1 ATP synthase subunit delta [Gammaproteobacteria bacterium]
MAEAITIARPYANAVFNIANDKVELKAWSELLAVFAQFVEDGEIAQMIASPSVTDEQVIDLMANVTGETVNDEARHLLMLLAENNRLSLLGDIAVIYEELRAEAEQVMTADVSAAKPLTEEQEANISAALKKRTGRDVTLNVEVDESLLGGAVIRAGDLIIDGSALGKLNRLANVIN